MFSVAAVHQFSDFFLSDGSSSQLSSAKKKKRFRKKLSAKRRLRLRLKEEMKRSGSESGPAAEIPEVKGRKKSVHI